MVAFDMQILRRVVLIVILAGLSVLIVGTVAGLRQVRRIEDWRAADARIMGSFGTNSQPPVANYEFWYTVGQANFTTKWSNPAPTVDAMKDRVARREVGTTVQILYNPSNPNEVDPNLGYNSATLGGAVLLAGAGLATVLAGFGVLLITRRNETRW